MPEVLFPAHAGVILLQPTIANVNSTFPRTRGGDPVRELFSKLISNLFPAHAGVIPYQTTLEEVAAAFPRTRGGDPPLRGYTQM